MRAGIPGADTSPSRSATCAAHALPLDRFPGGARSGADPREGCSCPGWEDRTAGEGSPLAGSVPLSKSSGTPRCRGSPGASKVLSGGLVKGKKNGQGTAARAPGRSVSAVNQINNCHPAGAGQDGGARGAGGSAGPGPRPARTRRHSALGAIHPPAPRRTDRTPGRDRPRSPGRSPRDTAPRRGRGSEGPTPLRVR